MLTILLLAVTMEKLPLPHAAAPDPSYLPQLVERARKQGASKDLEWRALLHYRGGRSELGDPRFFLSGDGKKDAQAELEATLAALFAPPRAYETNFVRSAKDSVDMSSADDGEMHPQCRFPARTNFLRRQLKIDPERLPQQPCIRLSKWFQRLDMGQVYLVFADADMGNPSAAYGHTFLRIGRASMPGHPLLSYVVNYAGEVDTKNPILYAFKGVLGFFPGRYSTMPYYVKVREYVDTESRDLWEYKLNLNDAERLRMAQHLWELRGAWARYFFFDDNCSYQIAALLEVARPSSRLRRHFGAWVIPIDTVDAVAAEGMLSETVNHRPSRISRLAARRASLGWGDARMVPRLAKSAELDLGARPPELQAAMIDAAIEWHELHYPPDRHDEAGAKRHAALLARRAALPTVASQAIPRPEHDPTQGHRSPRLVLGGALVNDRPALNVRWTASYHDLLDQPEGRNLNTRLHMGLTELRILPEQRRLVMDRFAVIDLFSAAPFSAWVPVKAWSIEAGWRRLFERHEAEAAGELEVNQGIAFGLGDSRLWLLGGGFVHAGPQFEYRVTGGASARFGLLLRMGRHLRLLAEARSRWTLFEPEPRHRIRGAAALDLGRNWQLRGGLDWSPSRFDPQMGVAWHY